MSPRGKVTNLALQSDRVDLAPWALSAATAPAYGSALPASGAISVARVLTDDANPGSHIALQSIAVPGRAIVSAYVKKVAGSGVVIISINSGAAFAYLDTTNISSFSSFNGAISASDEGAGWVRVCFASSLPSASLVSIQTATAVNNAVSTGPGTQQLAVGGVQVEIAQPGQTTPSPYVASGATAGVGRRDARQNYYRFSDDLTKSEHIKNTGVVIVSGSLDVPAPSDVPTAAVQKWTYDGSGVAGDYRLYSNASAIELLYRKGVPYAWAMWMRTASGTIPLRIQVCINVQSITVTSTWQRFLILATGNGSSGIQPTVFSAVANNAAFTLYTAGAQLVQGNNMPDYIATLGAPANANGAPRSIVL